MLSSLRSVLLPRHLLFPSCFALLLICCWHTGTSHAGGGPENVLLVVNRSSIDSMTVANHYIDLRRIPPRNVLYLDYPPGKAVTQGKNFKNRILEPIMQAIEKRNLTSQIDYVVYSCDFPWCITFKPSFPDDVFPRQLMPVASLSSATYFAAFVREDRKEMFSLGANFYCTPPEGNVLVSRGFRSQYRWTPGGRRANTEGLPYILSAVLGVKSSPENATPGNTVEEMTWYLGRSASADGTSPKGTIYYARNDTVRSKARDKDFSKAIGLVQMEGVRAEIVNGFFPKYRTDVAGVTSGHSKVEPGAAQIRMLPGAFCDNLTSSGGQFAKGKGQTCLSEFLRLGAAGACGTVVEPFAIPQKFPNATQHAHYVRGCSLAESFYQSVSGPFQQILVGDPLCQPWAKIPEVTVEGIEKNSVLSGSVELMPSATKGLAEIKEFQLYVDAQLTSKCQPGKTLSLDTTKLEDGYHELRVVAIDSSPIETQGRLIEIINVKNGTNAVQLSVDESSLAKSSEHINLKVFTTVPTTTTIFSNGTKLGSIEGVSGEISVPKQDLGYGPLTLQAVSTGKPGLRARPVRVELPH